MFLLSAVAQITSLLPENFIISKTGGLQSPPPLNLHIYVTEWFNSLHCKSMYLLKSLFILTDSNGLRGLTGKTYNDLLTLLCRWGEKKELLKKCPEQFFLSFTYVHTPFIDFTQRGFYWLSPKGLFKEDT